MSCDVNTSPTPPPPFRGQSLPDGAGRRRAPHCKSVIRTRRGRGGCDGFDEMFIWICLWVGGGNIVCDTELQGQH